MIDRVNPFEGNSTLFEFCCRVYDAMADNADDGVYAGTVSSLLNELEIPVTYSTRIMRQLQNGGYVEQTERGSAARPSVFRLWKRPEADSWKNLYDKPLTNSRRADNLKDISSRVAALEKRLAGLDLIKALSELTEEIKGLSSKISELETQHKAQQLEILVLQNKPNT